MSREVDDERELTEPEMDEVMAPSGFPVAAKRTSFGSWTITLVWSERLIDRWVSEQREHADTIKRLLG